MKIIATAGRDDLIVQMSKDEVAQVMGHSSDYQMEQKDRNAFDVGRMYDIKERYLAIVALIGLPRAIQELETSVLGVLEKVKKASTVMQDEPIITEASQMFERK